MCSSSSSFSWKCHVATTIDVSEQIRKDLEDYIGDFIDILPYRYAQTQRPVRAYFGVLEELYFLHGIGWLFSGIGSNEWNEWTFA